ncbi:MAG: RDD family protein [Phycisphaerae bacterium]|nr:RDD family protein [Phycisphaerae bacterium]
MDWYYAVGGERFGPFDQEAFDQLVSQGRITGVTLVWRDGLDDWVQYQLLAGPTSAEPGAAPPILAWCSQCRRQASNEDMVQYQGLWVCSECKDAFYQRVREGGFSPQDPANLNQRRFAGFWIRFGAAILDTLILIVVFVIIGVIVDRLPIRPTMNIAAILLLQFTILLVQLAIFLWYVTWFLGKFGATPGKMACGLKVIVSRGNSISYLRAFARGWAEILNFVIIYILIVIVVILVSLGLGVLAGRRNVNSSGFWLLLTIISVAVSLACFFPFYMAGLTRQKCGLHDFICNTRVVHAR